MFALITLTDGTQHIATLGDLPAALDDLTGLVSVEVPLGTYGDSLEEIAADHEVDVAFGPISVTIAAAYADSDADLAAVARDFLPEVDRREKLDAMTDVGKVRTAVADLVGKHDEDAHAAEDTLHLAVLAAIADGTLDANQAPRAAIVALWSTNLDFARWYA